jgi:chemotaxis signal transduction protein
MESATASNLFIIIQIGTVHFAIPADQVQMVADFTQYQSIPGGHHAVLGLASKRSQIITLIDPQKLMEDGNCAQHSSIKIDALSIRAIVFSYHGFDYGVVIPHTVDSFESTNEYMPKPSDLSNKINRFTSALIYLNEKFYPVLDLAAVIKACSSNNRVQ